MKSSRRDCFIAYLKLEFVRADFAAFHAGWPLAFLVHSDVFVQVCFLCEGLIAVLLRAHERSLSGVDA